MTRAERQIRDLGGEARDYDPHGAISTPSHLNRLFLRFRQADSLPHRLTGVETGHFIFCMTEASHTAITHRHSHFVRPTASSFVGVGYYHTHYCGLSKPSVNSLPYLQFKLYLEDRISTKKGSRTTGKRLFFISLFCMPFLGWSSCFTFGLPCRARPRVIVLSSRGPHDTQLPDLWATK